MDDRERVRLRHMPGIPWLKITAMRNRLTHAYFDRNLEAVWVVLTSSLPPLIAELEKVLDPPARLHMRL